MKIEVQLNNKPFPEWNSKPNQTTSVGRVLGFLVYTIDELADGIDKITFEVITNPDITSFNHQVHFICDNILVEVDTKSDTVQASAKDYLEGGAVHLKEMQYDIDEA